MARKIGGLVASLAVIATFAAGLHAQHGGGLKLIAAPATLEVPAKGLRLPMKDVGGRPVVDVMIDGKGPYRFILDTGASGNVIDTALQSELQLPKAPLSGAFSAHGPAMTMVSVKELRVGEAKLGGLIAVVMPLGKLFSGDQGPRGVLSALAFPGHLVTFDYPGRKITIIKGKLDSDDAKRTFAYGTEDPLPTVTLRMAEQDVRVHLDTGSGYGLMLPRHYLDELPLATKPVKSGKSKTPMGEFPISVAKVKGPVQLGAYTLDLGDIRFTDVSPGGGPPRGNLGYEALRGFVVTLDSRNHRLRLER